MSVQIATRREFLTQGLGLVGVGAALPNFLIQTALAGPKARSDESILVVVQLSGGHDGLSAVVPYSNDHYASNRQETRITANEVLKIDDEIGLHPNLAGFKDLLDQGAFAAVQGVGYPNANRSHFKSMDIWHSADNSGQAVSYGWLGRYCDHAFKGNRDAKLAIALGGNKSPRAIFGKEHPGIKFQRADLYRYQPESKDPRLGTLYRKLNKMTQAKGSANKNLEFVTGTTLNATSSSDEILKLAGKRTSEVTYPTGGLATSLQTVAALIAGGLSTRVYYVFQGGFDTHRGQRARHDQLMTELGGAIAAFQKDLAGQGNSERVLTMSFSEFGRRAKENGSQGTDHGKAGPMFLIGPGVKAGIHGELPSLADADLDRGDLKHTVDFRSVYATVLEKWLGCPSEPVLGADFPLVDCLG